MVDGWSTGSGDGISYTEIYERGNEKLQLTYDYYGRLCFEEITPPVSTEGELTAIPVDNFIRLINKDLVTDAVSKTDPL